MALTQEQETMYAAMNEMFETPGWAYLTQGWQQEMDQLPSAAFFNVKSVEELEAVRVRYGLLHELVTLPETLRAQRQQVIESDEDV